ncbi:MAG: hypothetical protein Q9159_006022 [Coniocarpon cinnabarinum]
MPLLTERTVWQWDQLRIMKVGGNESATKYFQSHGGSAALASKDPKTKYTSNAASKYKEELNRRVAVDTEKYPEEVIITDVPDEPESNGTSTPAEPDNDFFSSWDKPTIKRPSNPPSRVGTPSQAGRTGSPFLNAGPNGGPNRPKSPLKSAGSEENGADKKSTPAVAAVRKTPTASANKPKANILGAKKKGLGAKKVTNTEDLDFEEAERKAREEAERIEKLGYNPDEETPAPAQQAKDTPASSNAAPAPQIAAPQPVNASHHRASSDVERLGMGVNRLGFGQMKKGPGAATAAKSKPMGGFGAVSRTPQPDTETETAARDKFGTQKGISSDEYFGRGQYDANSQAEAKSRLQGFEGATSISSNAYFGRPEEEEMAGGANGDYGDIEGMARDVIRKFGITAGDDLDNVRELLGEGATRLQGAIRNYLNS